MPAVYFISFCIEFIFVKYFKYVIRGHCCALRFMENSILGNNLFLFFCASCNFMVNRWFLLLLKGWKKIIVQIFSSRIFSLAAQNIFMTEEKFQMCAPLSLICSIIVNPLTQSRILWQQDIWWTLNPFVTV